MILWHMVASLRSEEDESDGLSMSSVVEKGKGDCVRGGIDKVIRNETEGRANEVWSRSCQRYAGTVVK